MNDEALISRKRKFNMNSSLETCAYNNRSPQCLLYLFIHA